jgi:hypothetical protein
MALSLLGGLGINISCAYKIFRQLDYDKHCVGYGVAKELVWVMYAALHLYKFSGIEHY